MTYTNENSKVSERAVSQSGQLSTEKMGGDLMTEY